MREILFRGKTYNGKWVQGDLSQHKIGKKFIKCGSAIQSYEVIPETIGQYTGLTDKNGTKIFEGDIVRTDKGKIYEIKMQKGCWIVWNDKAKMIYDKWDFLNTFAPTIEVIGNLHNNPELLKDG